MCNKANKNNSSDMPLDILLTTISESKLTILRITTKYNMDKVHTSSIKKITRQQHRISCQISKKKIETGQKNNTSDNVF